LLVLINAAISAASHAEIPRAGGGGRGVKSVKVKRVLADFNAKQRRKSVDGNERGRGILSLEYRAVEFGESRSYAGQ
jgi:hypothetical protein